MKHLNLAGLSLATVLSAALACSAPPGNGPDGDGDGDGDARGGRNGDGDGDGDGDHSPPVHERCAESKLADAALRRLTAEEFQASIEDIFPEITGTWGGVALGADPIGYTGFTNDSRTLLVGPQSADEILRTALDVATLLTASQTLASILPCSTTSPDSACAETFVGTYGERLYRQALTDEERTELVSYFESVAARSDFTMGLKWMIVTMLQSPYFVYRSELGDSLGELSADEVATQLAYMFSGSTPSVDLLARARAGEFSESSALVAVARELMANPRGRALLDSFFEQWSGYEEVRGATKEGIENFAEVRESMIAETRAFLDDVVFTSGGGVDDLLTAPFTYVDPLLAAHYGFGAPASGFEKVTRPDGQGIGLLAQGAILAAKGHPTMSSPVFRGLFVYEKMLCQEPPPVPEIVPGIDEAPPANTTRERFEIAHGGAACRNCHVAFEPFGFGLEGFDAAGRPRTEENGFPINTAASADVPPAGTFTFDGLEDLATQLAAAPLVTDCVSGQLSAFGFSGGGGEPCLAEEQRDELLRGSFGLVEYYLQLAAAPSMVRRKR